MSRHTQRVAELLAHEAALFLAREALSDPLITVTRAVAEAHGGRATVFVSVLPEEKSRSALSFLARRRETFSDYLKTHARLAPLPRIDFALDTGEENGHLPV